MQYLATYIPSTYAILQPLAASLGKTPGLPAPDDYTYCPINGTSCYFFSKGALAYGSANSACTARGGYLASWGSGTEQLQVRQATPLLTASGRLRRCGLPCFHPNVLLEQGSAN